MSGFASLLRKDLLEQWRTFRLPAIGIVFLIFGLASPLLAKYSGELVEQFAGNIEIIIPTPTIKYAHDQLIKNLGQIGPIAAILLGMGVVATEKKRGTAALIFTKPVTRSAFIISKFLALMATVTTGVVLGCAAGFAYTSILFETPPLGRYVYLTLLLLLALTVYAAITFLGSTILRSPLAAAGIGLAALAISLALGALPGLGSYMPVSLYGPAVKIALGEPIPSLFLPVAINLAIVATSILIAWISFRRQTL